MMKWFLRTTAVVGNTCDRAHFYKGIYFHFRMCERICLIFFLTCYILSILRKVVGWKTTTHGLLEGIAQLYPTDPCSGTFHSYEPQVRNLDAASRLCLPTVLFHRLTANRRLQVTVTTAGMVRWGRVFAATWVTGELDGNFKTMMTSCCSWSLNMRGLWRRRRRKFSKSQRGLIRR